MITYNDITTLLLLFRFLRLLDPLSLRHFLRSTFFQIPPAFGILTESISVNEDPSRFDLYKQRRLSIQLTQVDDDDDDLPSPVNSISRHSNTCEGTLKSWCQGRTYSPA